MQVQISETSDLGRQMAITIPAATVDEMLTQRYTELTKTVKIDGFRPGKVPVEEVKKRYGEKVTQEVVQQIMQQQVPTAITENKVQPAGQPRINDLGNLQEGADYTFKVDFDVYPTIEPKGYEKIKLTRDVATPDDKMVDEALMNIFNSAKQYEKKDGAVADGDQALLDAVGYLAGEKEPFEGGRLEGFNVVIGSGSLIPGFEEELVGLKAGDEKSFDITFPKDYHAEAMAGQAARFECVVKEVQGATKTEPDDEFAKNFGAEDLADLKAKVQERTEQDLKEASEQRIKRNLFDALDKENQFAVPEGLVNAEFDSIWQAQMQELQQRGLPPEALGKSIDEMRTEFRDLAERRVRLGLLLAEIGKQQAVDVKDADVDAEIARMAEQAGPQAQQLKEYYAQPQNRQQLIGPLFEQAVVAWIMETSDVTEKEVKAAELIKEFTGQ